MSKLKMRIKLTNLPEFKVKDVWIISLAYAKSLFKNILEIKILFVYRLSKFFQLKTPAHFRIKGILNHDKIILV